VQFSMGLLIFMKDFRSAVTDDRVYVFDGAMGTMLYSRGIYINRCYDELNLLSPDLVLGVQREYVKAGADILESNTYGANRAKLSGYGLEDKIRDINYAGARIAREAAGDRAFVAGAIGPLGIRIEPYGPTSIEEAQAIFREQAQASSKAALTCSCLKPSLTWPRFIKRLPRFALCATSRWSRR
jgi:methionine synthase / methylenetetrahydrofolate reductase(NADPH)